MAWNYKDLENEKEDQEELNGLRFQIGRRNNRIEEIKAKIKELLDEMGKNGIEEIKAKIEKLLDEIVKLQNEINDFEAEYDKIENE